jgi:hypothetical protein
VADHHGSRFHAYPPRGALVVMLLAAVLGIVAGVVGMLRAVL